jgi:disulfide bond formation protein DsbB
MCCWHRPEGFHVKKPDLWALPLLAALCAGALGAALYFQHVLDWQPCPLCIMQRLAFVVVLVCALLALLVRSEAGRKRMLGFGLLSAFSGFGVAAYHVWVIAHPKVSCGIDPLETQINALWLVQQMPWLLKADGLCSTPYPPVMGLHMPTWTLLLMGFSACLFVWCSVKSNR